MEHRQLPPTENAPDLARLALQPREVKFSDLAPLVSRRSLESPKSERRGFRPTPQKVHMHIAKTAKSSFGDGVEGESGEEEERRRGRQRMHDGKQFRSKVTKALPKLPLHSELITDRIEISGNAVRVEDSGFSAVSVLTMLGNTVARERRMKEELARIHAAKMSAFRAVINVYMTSVKQSPKVVSGRRKAASVFALAQCAVVAQTLVVAIQSYMRAFQSRAHTAIRRYLWRNGLDQDAWCGSSVRMPQFKQRAGSEISALSENTSSLHELLDEEEINRLKQLYFDYYDCDVYVIPGTIPEGAMPPNAQMLTSLSANDPFLPDGDDIMENTSLLTSITSSND